jgi:hypothetical protein
MYTYIYIYYYDMIEKGHCLRGTSGGGRERKSTGVVNMIDIAVCT